MFALRRWPVAGLIAVLMVTGAACGSSPTAATITFEKGTVTIDRSDFEKELKALHDNKKLHAASGGGGIFGSGKGTLNNQLSSRWLTLLIYDELIKREVEARNLKVLPEDNEAAKAQLNTRFFNAEAVAAFPKWFQKKVFERGVRASALRHDLLGFNISEAGLQAYYESRPGRFSNICTSHVLVESQAEADAALARLKGGEDFAAVAEDVSTDQGTADKGGDLGCNPGGVYVPEFDKVTQEVPINQLSDIVKTEFGFHIILVKERTLKPYAEVREEVAKALDAEAGLAFTDFIIKAGTAAKVTLDKRYGTFASDEAGKPPEVQPPLSPRVKDERTDQLTPIDPGKKVTPPDIPGTTATTGRSPSTTQTTG